MTYKRKKLEELNLLDNFLLGSMMTHPEYGEKVCKQLLQVILQRNFKNLTVIPQKVYFGSDTDLHGAILDVYMEETKGKVGIPSKALQELLAYMEDSTINNVKNEMPRDLHNMVEHVKHEEEVSIKYMRMMESESYLLNVGREEGLEEGLEEGRRIGFIETCKELGLSEEETVNRFMKKFLLSISETMEYVKKQWESH